MLYLAFQTELGIYWKFCWTFFVPCSLSGILLYTLATYEPVRYAKVPLPDAAQIFGWILFTFGVLIICSVLIYTYVKLGSWKQILKSNDNWGPKNSDDKVKWLQMTKDLSSST